MRRGSPCEFFVSVALAPAIFKCTTYTVRQISTIVVCITTKHRLCAPGFSCTNMLETESLNLGQKFRGTPCPHLGRLKFVRQICYFLAKVDGGNRNVLASTMPTGGRPARLAIVLRGGSLQSEGNSDSSIDNCARDTYTVFRTSAGVVQRWRSVGAIKDPPNRHAPPFNAAPTFALRGRPGGRSCTTRAC